jgi:hypothetical protein
MVNKVASLFVLAVLSDLSVTVEAAAAASGDKDKMHGVLKEVVLKGVHSSASVRNLIEGNKNQKVGNKNPSKPTDSPRTSPSSRPTYSPTAESIACVDGIIASGTSSCKTALRWRMLQGSR